MAPTKRHNKRAVFVVRAPVWLRPQLLINAILASLSALVSTTIFRRKMRKCPTWEALPDDTVDSFDKVLPFIVTYLKIALAAELSKRFKCDVKPEQIVLVSTGCRCRYTPENYDASQAGHAPCIGGAAALAKLARLLGVAVEQLLQLCWPHVDSIMLTRKSLVVLVAITAAELGFVWREGRVSDGFETLMAKLGCYDAVVMPATAANEMLHQMVGLIKASPNPAKLAEACARARLEFYVDHPAVDFGAAGDVLADEGEQYQVEEEEETEGEEEESDDEGDATEF